MVVLLSPLLSSPVSQCLLPAKKQLPVDQSLTGNASPVGLVSGSYYLKEWPQRFMSTLQLTQV